MKATNIYGTPDATTTGASTDHQMIENIARQGVERAEAVTHRLLETVSVARGRLSALGSDVQGRARQAATVTDRYVHESPWQAMGIGAAVGVLVGIMIARR